MLQILRDNGMLGFSQFKRKINYKSEVVKDILPLVEKRKMPLCMNDSSESRVNYERTDNGAQHYRKRELDSLKKVLKLYKKVIGNYRPQLNNERYLTDKEVPSILKVHRRTLQKY